MYEEGLAGNGRSFFEQHPNGHLDYPRAIEGGFGGGFFAIYIPNKAKEKEKYMKKLKKAAKQTPDDLPMPPPLRHKYALRQAMAESAYLFQSEEESDGKFKIVRDADELAFCLQNNIMAAIWHFEGAEAIDKNLDALHIFYGAGLRSLGLVWSRPTKFASGVPFSFPRSPDIGDGLTEIGKALLRECNQLGIMVDLSHLNEKGFWDVANSSTAPLVATHSNAHTLCASPRNLTDKQLDAIKASDGMVGINFHKGFLREDGDQHAEASLTEIVRHLDYIAQRIGIDRVGFGSDFDGAFMPEDLQDVTHLPKLLTALRDLGYDNAALRKITHENWVRVLRLTWK
jgi:membrane dipeptidase